jgi:hypothetical protein
MNVAGDDVVVAVGHTNEGLVAFEIFFFESGRHEQSPMGQGFNRFFKDIRPHTVHPPKSICFIVDSRNVL